MIYDAMICQRRLCELSQKPEEGWGRWPEKLEAVAVFEEAIQNKHCRIDDFVEPLQPLQRLQLISAKKITVSMHLLLRRPPYRQPYNSVPPWDEYDVLDAATEVLEQHLQANPQELEPWVWKNWVQWHALAVLLAELTVRPRGQSWDRSYTVACQSFSYYARLVADSESGLLWKPIARLMHRVQRLRKESVPAPTQDLSNGTTVHQPDIPDELDPGFFVGLDMFSDWDVNSNVADLMLTTEDITSSQAHDTQPSTYMPTLAWDAFLQDISLGST